MPFVILTTESFKALPLWLNVKINDFKKLQGKSY